MRHELKIDPLYFEAILSDKKTFEIRKDDRGFKEKDYLVLKEYSEDKYTGREVEGVVTYIISSKEFPDGLKDNYVVMGIWLI